VGWGEGQGEGRAGGTPSVEEGSGGWKERRGRGEKEQDAWEKGLGREGERPLVSMWREEQILGYGGRE
jgi:hypothetical protein